MLMQRAWLRTTRPAAMLVCVLAASMAVVALYVHHEDMEAVLLQKAKKLQLFIDSKALDKVGLNFRASRKNVIKSAMSPIQEDDVPPFGESINAPPPACDQTALMDCLGALQADKRAFPHKHNVVGENDDVNEFFCKDMHIPFECACKACDTSNNVTASWANVYWQSDYPAKKIFLDMRSEAQCTRLKNAGAMTLPGGHGCHQLFHKACDAPLDQYFCPRILQEGSSALGVAQTMENDDVKWIQQHKTCRTEGGWEKELDCKAMLKKTLDPHSNYCAPHHEYLRCMCDACEEDVEEQVEGSQRYQRCHQLENTLVSHPPSDECDLWYQDECKTPLNRNYCEHVQGTRAQRKPPAVAGSWEEDGMQWGTYCDTVLSLAKEQTALEDTLGDGWVNWCLEKAGQTKLEAGNPPFGSAEGGHQWLEMSGMPSPPTYDVTDPALGYFNVDTNVHNELK